MFSGAWCYVPYARSAQAIATARFWASRIAATPGLPSPIKMPPLRNDVVSDDENNDFAANNLAPSKPRPATAPPESKSKGANKRKVATNTQTAKVLRKVGAANVFSEPVATPPVGLSGARQRRELRVSRAGVGRLSTRIVAHLEEDAHKRLVGDAVRVQENPHRHEGAVGPLVVAAVARPDGRMHLTGVDRGVDRWHAWRLRTGGARA